MTKGVIEYEFLTTAASTPDVLIASVESSQLDLAVTAWRRDGLYVTVLRGSRMRNRADAYDEMAAAFQFPSAFGQNLNALSEYLEWFFWIVEPPKGWVIAVTAPELLFQLEESPDSDLWQLVDVFLSAKAYWAGDVRHDSDFAASKPFSIVLTTTQATDLASQWAAVGATVHVTNGLPANPTTVHW